MRKKRNTILALDPGLRELGYAVLTGRRLVDAGVLPLRYLPAKERVGEARRQVRGWLKVHHPQVLVVERTYHHPVPWLDRVHRLALSAEQLAKRRHMKVATYSPQRVRQTVVGNGKATKAEVATVVANRYAPLRLYLTQDRRWKERYWQNMFDAIALALHHRSVT